MKEENGDTKQISKQRKTLYYTGLVLMGIGLVCFLSVFVNGFLTFSRPSFDMEGPGFMVWGLVGFVLILAGGILRGIGARGLAGSGLKLDPQQAREDLHPYTDAIGGMAKDAVAGFREAGAQADSTTAIRVRCQACQTLNEEDARYCKRCGQAI